MLAYVNSLLLWIAPVGAADHLGSPRDTVVRLYHDFSSEVVLEEPLQPGLWSEPVAVWQKYFSKRIVHLYARVLECEKDNVICATELSPIWWSQDPGSVTVSIQPGAVATTVVATIAYPKDAVVSGTAKLEFRLVQEGRDWKIDDIAYPDGSSLIGWLTDALKP